MDDIINRLRRSGLNEEQVERVAPFLGMDDLLNTLDTLPDRSGDLIDILEQTIREKGNILGSGHEVMESGIPNWGECKFTLTQDIPTMSLVKGTSFPLMSAQKPRDKGVKRVRGEVNTNPKYILVLLKPGKLAWLFKHSGNYYVRPADQRESRRVQLYPGIIECPSLPEEQLPEYQNSQDSDEEMRDVARRRGDMENYVIPARRTAFGKKSKSKSKSKEMGLSKVNKMIKALKKM